MIYTRLPNSTSALPTILNGYVEGLNRANEGLNRANKTWIERGTKSPRNFSPVSSINLDSRSDRLDDYLNS